MKELLCYAYGRCSYLTVANAPVREEKLSGSSPCSPRPCPLTVGDAAAIDLICTPPSAPWAYSGPVNVRAGQNERSIDQGRRRAAIFAGRRVFRTLRPPVRRVGLVGLVLCSWRPRLGDRDRITRLPRFMHDGLRLKPAAASSSCCLSFTTTLRPLVGRHHHARVNRPLSPPADNQPYVCAILAPLLDPTTLPPWPLRSVTSPTMSLEAGSPTSLCAVTSALPPSAGSDPS